MTSKYHVTENTSSK